ncbi:FimV/HubP family polar landmark protein [Legionella sainthelensi]|uniref:FimV/HubP family polar landmark protein n=1 Tax=Legionella sainthelensi TaxID=28087 RepID=UPI001055F45B|nr:FimV/HubP family polar landmark protein [Legionella sainthelensi]
MKKNVLFSALFALTWPAYVNALGLGEMKVKSALEQPFAAEVNLIDVHEISLSNVRVNIADPQSYQSLGVERPGVADSLFFEIKKNKKRKFVIVIYSTERITEPYLQLIIDLTWSKGQIYKVYTVLLDPPGYKLASATAQSGLTYQRQFSNYHSNTEGSPNKKIRSKKNNGYGPTVSQENVWQIAQRYKTANTILPQIVLAIVGANPDAFTDGNLNGLKVGVRLKIPSAQEFSEVPADLATVEVMAHDKAWNEKASINHVLSPPYMIGQTSNVNPPIEYSQIPPVPKFSGSTLPVSNQTQSESTSVSLLPSLENQKHISYEQSKTLNAEISITTAAVDSLRESNALLTEQLSLLQTQNKKLQKQLNVRDKEITSLHKQIHLLIQERIADQSNSSFFNNMLITWLLIATGAGSIAFYFFKRKEDKKNNSSKLITPSPVESESASIESSMNTKEEPAIQDKISELQSQSDIELTPSPQFSDPLTEVENLKNIDDSKESVFSSIETPLKRDESEQSLDVPSANLTSDLDEDQLARSSHESKSASRAGLAEENLLKFEPAATNEELTSDLDEDQLAQSNHESKSVSREELVEENLLKFEPAATNEELTSDLDEDQLAQSNHESKSALREELVEENLLKFEPAATNEELTSDLDEDQLARSSHESKSASRAGLAEENLLKFEPAATNEELTSDLDEDQLAQSNHGNKGASREELAEENLLEFEAGLYDTMTKEPIQVTGDSKEVDHENKHGLEFTLSIPDEEQTTQNDMDLSSLKNEKALDTLLALARTYIGMEDKESALNSLDDVLKHGTKTQKEEAKRLLAEIKGTS